MDETDYTHRVRVVMGGACGWTWYCRSPGCVSYSSGPKWDVVLECAIVHAFTTPREQQTIHVNGYYVMPGSADEAWALSEPWPPA